MGEGSHQIHCRIVRLEGGFSNTSTAKHATHTSPKMAGFFSCLSDGRAEASSAPSLAPGVADPRSPAQAVPPEQPAAASPAVPFPGPAAGCSAGPSWAPGPGPIVSAGERPRGEASDRGLTPDPGSHPPSRVRGRRHGSPRSQLPLFDLWIRGPGAGRGSYCTKDPRRGCRVRGCHTYRRAAGGSGAPPPARVAGPPHPAVSQHRERRPSGGRGRTAVKKGPYGSAPRRAPKAREMRCSEAEAPNAQWRANRGGGRHGIPRKAAPIRGLGRPRGPPGAGGAAGRGRAVCGEAGPRLEFGLLWPGGRPARPSCRAASPRGPRPSPGNSLRSCGGGRVLSHQTRWMPRPGLPDAARRRLRGCR